MVGSASVGVGANQITGVVLAGGRSRRMGGQDKGLQPFLDGRPLAAHVLDTLRPQVDYVAINANQYVPRYAALGAPVWPDPPELVATLGAFAGPLVGMLAALQRCETNWLLTVACDCPYFPADLSQRLASAMERAPDQWVAVAAVGLSSDISGTDSKPNQGDGGQKPAESDAEWRREPVFCLIHRNAATGLAAFLANGGRRINAWLDLAGALDVHFESIFSTNGQIHSPFANANTLDELRQLETAMRRRADSKGEADGISAVF